ncbi:MAG: hypothetical protein J0G95_10870 [Rhizobiales bacterium]|nr:hypothetical protein [Hyphomicrobiales bacterium]
MGELVHIRDYQRKEELMIPLVEPDGHVIYASPPPPKDTAPCECEVPWEEGA